MGDPSNGEVAPPYQNTLPINGDISHPRLQIIIVGSGLAGLATARILREHHNVTIIERGSPELATGGQGICFFISTVKILKTMVYDTKRVKPFQITYFRHHDRLGDSESSEYLGWEERYGADPWSQLRSDCRDELFRLATAPAEEIGLPDTAPIVTTMFNTPVVDVDPENAIVRLGDGSTRQADMVIIADGIHSRLRNIVLGDDSHVVKKMGLTIFRVAVSVSEAKKSLDELPHWMVPDKEGKGCITYFQSLDDTNRLIVTYPLRNFEYIHCSLHLPTGLGHGTTTQSWHADANRKEIIDAFEGFSPTLLKLVRIGTQVKVWDMQDLDPDPLLEPRPHNRDRRRSTRHDANARSRCKHGTRRRRSLQVVRTRHQTLRYPSHTAANRQYQTSSHYSYPPDYAADSAEYEHEGPDGAV